MTIATDPGPGDERFNVGLLIDVARVIEDHGYGRCAGAQIVELQQHLFHFLHGDPTGSCTGGSVVTVCPKCRNWVTNHHPDCTEVGGPGVDAEPEGGEG